MKDQNYVNQLERAVQVLANSNSNWDMNVSVWDRERILSILDYISMAEMRMRTTNSREKNDDTNSKPER